MAASGKLALKKSPLVVWIVGAFEYQHRKGLGVGDVLGGKVTQVDVASGLYLHFAEELDRGKFGQDRHDEFR